MGDQWYIRSRNGLQGPFSDKAIEGYAREGRLKASQQISQDQQSWHSPAHFGFLTAETLPERDRDDGAASKAALAQSEQTYFIRIRGQIQGPMSLKQLRQLVRRGKLARIHQVSTDQQVWRSATKLEGLFGPVQPVPPVPDSAPDHTFEYEPPVVDSPDLPPAPVAGVRRSGKRINAAQALGPRALNVTYLAGAVLLLGGFFLPWIDLVIVRIAGYQVPYLGRKVMYGASELSKAVGGSGVPLSLQLKVLSLYLLYLIPLSCSLGAAREFSLFQQGRNCFLSKLISALSPLIAVFLIIFVFIADVDLTALSTEKTSQPGAQSAPATGVRTGAVGEQVGKWLDLFGLGFYMSLAGMLLAGIGTFINPVPREVYGARPRRRRQ